MVDGLASAGRGHGPRGRASRDDRDRSRSRPSAPQPPRSASSPAHRRRLHPDDDRSAPDAPARPSTQDAVVILAAWYELGRRARSQHLRSRVDASTTARATSRSGPSTSTSRSISATKRPGTGHVRGIAGRRGAPRAVPVRDALVRRPDDPFWNDTAFAGASLGYAVPRRRARRRSRRCDGSSTSGGLGSQSRLSRVVADRVGGDLLPVVAHRDRARRAPSGPADPRSVGSSRPPLLRGGRSTDSRSQSPTSNT